METQNKQVANKLKKLVTNIYMQVTNNSIDEGKKEELYSALEPFADGDYSRGINNMENKRKVIPRRLKEDKNSAVVVQVKDDEWQDAFGRVGMTFHWEVLKEPLNLGSINHPSEASKKIIGWKVADTTKRKGRFRDFLERFDED